MIDFKEGHNPLKSLKHKKIKQHIFHIVKYREWKKEQRSIAKRKCELKCYLSFLVLGSLGWEGSGGSPGAQDNSLTEGGSGGDLEHPLAVGLRWVLLPTPASQGSSSTVFSASPDAIDQLLSHLLSFSSSLHIVCGASGACISLLTADSLFFSCFQSSWNVKKWLGCPVITLWRVITLFRVAYWGKQIWKT